MNANGFKPIQMNEWMQCIQMNSNQSKWMNEWMEWAIMNSNQSNEWMLMNKS